MKRILSVLACMALILNCASCQFLNSATDDFVGTETTGDSVCTESTDDSICTEPVESFDSIDNFNTALKKNPKQYIGQYVSITGYIYKSFYSGDSYIYLSNAHTGSYSNAGWIPLYMADEIYSAVLDDGDFVEICGMVDVKDGQISLLDCSYTMRCDPLAENGGHSYVVDIIPEEGCIVYTCSACGDTYTEVIAAVSVEITDKNRNQVGYIGKPKENLVIPAFFQNDDIWYRPTSIAYSAFRDCTGLASVIIPNGVTSVGGYAFSGCVGLTSVTIPDSVSRISSGAFQDCSGLTSIVISNSVTSIDPYAFYGCSGLTSIEIGNKVTIINMGTFGKCSGLTSIVIPDSVVSIGKSAFFSCSGLTSIVIPDSVTTIGESAFSFCTSLTSITFEGTVAQWKAISKESDWKYRVPATKVVCSDGTVSLK